MTLVGMGTNVAIQPPCNNATEDRGGHRLQDLGPAASPGQAPLGGHRSLESSWVFGEGVPGCYLARTSRPNGLLYPLPMPR